MRPEISISTEHESRLSRVLHLGGGCNLGYSPEEIQNHSFLQPVTGMPEYIQQISVLSTPRKGICSTDTPVSKTTDGRSLHTSFINKLNIKSDIISFSFLPQLDLHHYIQGEQVQLLHEYQRFIKHCPRSPFKPPGRQTKCCWFLPTLTNTSVPTEHRQLCCRLPGRLPSATWPPGHELSPEEPDACGSQRAAF